MDSDILCGMENSWLMGLAAVLKVQLLLRFGVRGECECSLQARLAGVCLLVCLFAFMSSSAGNSSSAFSNHLFFP